MAAQGRSRIYQMSLMLAVHGERDILWYISVYVSVDMNSVDFFCLISAASRIAIITVARGGYSRVVNHRHYRPAGHPAGQMDCYVTAVSCWVQATCTRCHRSAANDHCVLDYW